MSKLQELINELCPDGVEHKPIKFITKVIYKIIFLLRQKVQTNYLKYLYKKLMFVLKDND